MRNVRFAKGLIYKGCLNFALVALTVLALISTASAGELTYKIYAGKGSGVKENSVLIMGEKDCILIDGQWTFSDATNVADMIEKSGKRLTHILITHGHPDHYWGLEKIVARFPNARVYARQGTVDEIVDDFAAKWVHWEPLFGHDGPTEPFVPDVFNAPSIELEGKEVIFVDLPISESARTSTAFYLPSEKTLITGDVIYNKMHMYYADTNNPTSWLKALDIMKSAGPIETVIPGHGEVGGPELIDQAIEYQTVFKSIAKPGVKLPEIANGMTKAFPDWEMDFILWWTRGPGFGIFGPRAIGVPERLLEDLPPHLLGPSAVCSKDQKALIDKLFYEGFSGGDMKVLDEVFSADIKFEDPAFPPGLEGLKVLVRKNNESFEGWNFKLNDRICSNDKVTVRWTGSGKHVGSFMGEKPTQRNIVLNGTSIYQLKNNKIIADWVTPDNLGFLMQIGVLSPVDMTK